jgi:Fe-S-cluster containining protein
MDLCKRCGQCCRTIRMPAHQDLEFFRRVAENPIHHANNRADAAFIVAHWDHVANPDGSHYFACKLLGKNGQCLDYANRPPLCSAFPRYDQAAIPANVKLHPGCGYGMSKRHV